MARRTREKEGAADGGERTDGRREPGRTRSWGGLHEGEPGRIQRDLPLLLKYANRMIGSGRAVVEHPFACTRQMGHQRVRCRGRRRHERDFALMKVADNCKPTLCIVKCGEPAAPRTPRREDPRTTPRPLSVTHLQPPTGLVVQRSPASAFGQREARPPTLRSTELESLSVRRRSPDAPGSLEPCGRSHFNGGTVNSEFHRKSGDRSRARFERPTFEGGKRHSSRPRHLFVTWTTMSFAAIPSASGT